MMDLKNLTYLALMALTFLMPFSLSFDKRVHYFTRWRALFPSMLPMFSVFIVWDIIFTRNNVWWFNPDYVIGWYIAGLPLEEWLFFILVPFACVFIYDVLRHYFPIKPSNTGMYISILLLLLLVVGSILNLDRTYTLVNFITAIIIIIMQFMIKSQRTYLNAFYFAYVICLVPFLVVNGILTSLPVVGYNDAENMGLRVYTIPLEDFVYLYTLLLMNITFYEILKKRWQVA